MTWVEGHYDSIYGRIESAWRVDGDTVTYRFTVPANTTARLHLPTTAIESIRADGRILAEAPGVAFLRYERGRAVLQLASGRYAFTASR